METIFVPSASSEMTEAISAFLAFRKIPFEYKDHSLNTSDKDESFESDQKRLTSIHRQIRQLTETMDFFYVQDLDF